MRKRKGGHRLRQARERIGVPKHTAVIQATEKGALGKRDREKITRGAERGKALRKGENFRRN